MSLHLIGEPSKNTVPVPWGTPLTDKIRKVVFDDLPKTKNEIVNKIHKDKQNLIVKGLKIGPTMHQQLKFQSEYFAQS